MKKLAIWIIHWICLLTLLSPFSPSLTISNWWVDVASNDKVAIKMAQTLKRFNHRWNDVAFEIIVNKMNRVLLTERIYDEDMKRVTYLYTNGKYVEAYDLLDILEVQQ